MNRTLRLLLVSATLGGLSWSAVAAPERPTVFSYKAIECKLLQGDRCGADKGMVVEGNNSTPAPDTDPGSYRIGLPAIEFEFNSHQLTTRALEQLDEVAKALDLNTLRHYAFAVPGTHRQRRWAGLQPEAFAEARGIGQAHPGRRGNRRTPPGRCRHGRGLSSAGHAAGRRKKSTRRDRAYRVDRKGPCAVDVAEHPPQGVADRYRGLPQCRTPDWSGERREGDARVCHRRSRV